jgi:hypothetical protein
MQRRERRAIERAQDTALRAAQRGPLPPGLDPARDILLVKSTRRFEVVARADLAIALLTLGIDVDAELEAAVESVRRSDRVPVVVVVAGYASVTNVPIGARSAVEGQKA